MLQLIKSLGLMLVATPFVVFGMDQVYDGGIVSLCFGAALFVYALVVAQAE